jgi:steroid delta-isomerase-like uncharacterized protein
VKAFYERIWEAGDLAAASALVSEDVAFRGSLGTEVRGRDAFLAYVRGVRAALGDYGCEILACVAEGDQAFAQVRFSGTHVGEFRGYRPTGKRVAWMGAALFRFDRGVIAEVWVLGDLAGLDALLAANDAGHQRAE